MPNEYEHNIRKSKYLREIAKLKQYKMPLKRSRSGYEIEFNIIDQNGDVNNDSKKIITECKKINKEFPIEKEVGKNMVEITSLPFRKIQKTALYFLENIEVVENICLDNDLFLLPLGTYPGQFKEKSWKKKRYVYPANVIGPDKYYYYYSHCFGFHYHYGLPWGVFDRKAKFLKKTIKSKVKKTLLDSYNFLIAADPVLTIFTQSSPFEGGKYYAKDTRMLFLRGGKKLKYDGLYNKLQLLGGLPPYKQTLSDLIQTLNKKDKRMKILFEKTGAPQDFIKKKDKLDFVWNPVKVNQLGTLEQRGLDTNYPGICLGVSVMVKFILRAIQQEFYHVIPSDIGIEEPFKLEGNAIFIPSHSHTRNKMQYLSAYEGLKNKEMLNACSRFYKLARKLVYKEYIKPIKIIKNMIDKERTVSDMMINYVKRKGYDLDQKLPKELCRNIALLHSKKMIKHLERTKKIYEGLE